VQKLLTINELAEILQLKVSTIYGYTSRKKIPTYRIQGGKLRFSEDKIMKWLETQKIKKPEPPKFPGVDDENEDK